MYNNNNNVNDKDYDYLLSVVTNTSYLSKNIFHNNNNNNPVSLVSTKETKKDYPKSSKKKKKHKNKSSSSSLSIDTTRPTIQSISSASSSSSNLFLKASKIGIHSYTDNPTHSASNVPTISTTTLLPPASLSPSPLIPPTVNNLNNATLSSSLSPSPIVRTITSIAPQEEHQSVENTTTITDNNNVFVHASNKTLPEEENNDDEDLSLYSSLSPSIISFHDNELSKITTSSTSLINSSSSLPDINMNMHTMNINNHINNSSSSNITRISNQSNAENEIQSFSIISIGIIIGCSVGTLLIFLLFCRCKKSIENKNDDHYCLKNENNDVLFDVDNDSVDDKIVMPISTTDNATTMIDDVALNNDNCKISIVSPALSSPTTISNNKHSLSPSSSFSSGIAIEVLSTTSSRKNNNINIASNKSVASTNTSTSGWSFFNHEYFSDVYNNANNEMAHDNDHDHEEVNDVLEI